MQRQVWSLQPILPWLESVFFVITFVTIIIIVVIIIVIVIVLVLAPSGQLAAESKESVLVAL